MAGMAGAEVGSATLCSVSDCEAARRALAPSRCSRCSRSTRFAAVRTRRVWHEDGRWCRVVVVLLLVRMMRMMRLVLLKVLRIDLLVVVCVKEGLLLCVIVSKRR